MTPRARVALATMALLALIAVVYAPVLGGAFIWDDHALVETNELVEHGTVRQIFGHPYWAASPLSDLGAIYYRPLTMLSFRLDYAFGGTSEAPTYHASNLMMHLLATITLVLVARRLGASPLGAVIATAVWALHPRATECVAWISGRTDVMALGFGMAALGLWPWYGEPDASANRRAQTRQRARAAAAAAALLLALLSKEVAIVIALAIAAGTIAGTTARGRAARRSAVLVVPVAVYVLLRWLATRHETAKLPAVALSTRLATTLEAIGRYLEMTIDGWHPASSIGLVGELDRGRAALGACVVVACVAAVLRAVLRSKRSDAAGPPETAGAADATEPASPTRVSLVVAGVLIVAPLAMVVHVIPITLASAVTADRLLYLPLAGVAIGSAVACARLSSRQRFVAGTAALSIAASYVPATHARARDYTNELQFRVVAAERAHPHNTAPVSGVANMLRADAELDLACRLHASVRRTLELGPTEASARYIRALENLGGCYATAGDYERAAAVYADLLALRPDSARARMEIGFLELHTFALDRAEVSLRRAVELEPALTVAREALASLPRLREAVGRLTEEERAKDPLAWAELLTAIGRVPDATKAWLALALDPATADGPALLAGEFVIANADEATARRVGNLLMARTNVAVAERIERKLRARLKRQGPIDALRPRIEALAAR